MTILIRGLNITCCYIQNYKVDKNSLGSLEVWEPPEYDLMQKLQ